MKIIRLTNQPKSCFLISQADFSSFWIKINPVRYRWNSADGLEFYAAHNQELAQVLELEQSAVAGLHEDLAAVDGVVQGIVGIVLKAEVV